MGIDVIYFWDNPADVEGLSEAEIKERMYQVEADTSPVKSNKMRVFSVLLRQYVTSLDGVEDLEFYNGLIERSGEGKSLVKVVLPKEHNWILMRRAFVYARESGLMVYFGPLDFIVFPRGKVLPENMQKAVIEALDSPGVINFMHSVEVVKGYVEPKIIELTEKYGFHPVESKGLFSKGKCFSNGEGQVAVTLVSNIVGSNVGARIFCSIIIRSAIINDIRAEMDFSHGISPISLYINYVKAFDCAHVWDRGGANGAYIEFMLDSIESKFLSVYCNVKCIADFDGLIENKPKVWEVVCAGNPYSALIAAALIERPDFEKMSNHIMEIGCSWEDAKNAAEGHARFEKLKKHLIDNYMGKK